MTIDEVINILLAITTYFKIQGGLTVSGGDCEARFYCKALKAAHEVINTCVEIREHSLGIKRLRTLIIYCMTKCMDDKGIRKCRGIQQAYSENART